MAVADHVNVPKESVSIVSITSGSVNVVVEILADTPSAQASVASSLTSLASSGNAAAGSVLGFTLEGISAAVATTIITPAPPSIPTHSLPPPMVPADASPANPAPSPSSGGGLGLESNLENDVPWSLPYNYVIILVVSSFALTIICCLTVFVMRQLSQAKRRWTEELYSTKSEEPAEPESIDEPAEQDGPGFQHGPPRERASVKERPVTEEGRQLLDYLHKHFSLDVGDEATATSGHPVEQLTTSTNSAEPTRVQNQPRSSTNPFDSAPSKSVQSKPTASTNPFEVELSESVRSEPTNLFYSVQPIRVQRKPMASTNPFDLAPSTSARTVHVVLPGSSSTRGEGEDPSIGHARVGDDSDDEIDRAIAAAKLSLGMDPTKRKDVAMIKDVPYASTSRLPAIPRFDRESSVDSPCAVSGTSCSSSESPSFPPPSVEVVISTPGVSPPPAKVPDAEAKAAMQRRIDINRQRMKHAAAARARAEASSAPSDIVPLVDGDAPIGLNPTELIELNNLVRRVSTMEPGAPAPHLKLTAHHSQLIEPRSSKTEPPATPMHQKEGVAQPQAQLTAHQSASIPTTEMKETFIGLSEEELQELADLRRQHEADLMASTAANTTTPSACTTRGPALGSSHGVPSARPSPRSMQLSSTPESRPTWPRSRGS